MISEGTQPVADPFGEMTRQADVAHRQRENAAPDRISAIMQ